MDASEWSKWRREEVEKSGNDPSAWIAVAGNLLESGAVLASTSTAASRISLRNVLSGGPATDKPWTDEEAAAVRLGLRTHSATLMLFGFAVECLLKAVYLRRGGTLYTQGNYKNPTRLEKSHNLLGIANALGCADLFSAEQLDLLDHLSASNEMGRYPAHSRYDHYGIQPPDAEGKSKFYGIWSTVMSVILFRIFAALYAELNEPVPPAADALLEQRRVERSLYGMPDDTESTE